MTYLNNSFDSQICNTVYEHQDVSVAHPRAGFSKLSVRHEAKAFLQLLDPNAQLFTFQTFNDDKDRKNSRVVRVLHGSLEQTWDELAALNQKGAGIFITVNETDGQARRNENIIRIRGVFQDDDDGFQGTYPLVPSIEVKSSPGKFQRYWLCSGVTSEQFKTLQERLIQSFGCDKNVKDLARVLRLPGFYHLKDPAHPHFVTLLEPSHGTVYQAEELMSAFLGGGKADIADIFKKAKCIRQERARAAQNALDVGEDARGTSLSQRSPDIQSVGEKERIESALCSLPQKFVDDRSLWCDIGMALHSSGLPDARALYDEWSKGSTKFDIGGQDQLWNSLRRGNNGRRITIKTLFYHARQNGWIDPKRNYHHSDLGNAQRLVDRHGLNLRYVVEWGRWLIWRDGRWNVDNNFEIERLAKETVTAMWDEAKKLDSDEARTSLRRHALNSEAASRIHAMINQARSEEGVPISTSQLDRDDYLLGVQNGVIDLRTLTFREGRHEDYVTKFCGTHYDAEAKCPNWLRFLDRIFDGNEDIIGYIQRFDGYGLTGSVDEEVMRILWGRGKNGKSTYRETKRLLLGDYSDVCGVDVLLQKHDAGCATPQMAKLKGLRHLSVNETRENGKFSEQRVKNLTSNEALEARFLHQNPFTFMPSHKTDITTNHKPIITGTDEGIWRRIHLVPFTVTIPEEERDERYREKYLAPELAGILNWMLEGLRGYNEQGLKPPKEIQAATRAYRTEMDVIEQWLENNCLCSPQFGQPIQELYNNYFDYVGNEFRHVSPLSKRKFGDELADRGFEPDRGTGGGRIRKGLMLRDLAAGL